MDPYAQAEKCQLSRCLVTFVLFFFVIFAAWADTAKPFESSDRAIGSAPISEIACSGQHYKYYGLAAYGSVPSNATDRYGDTLGGFGSAVSIDQLTWSKGQDGSYDGNIWTMPDRGWNTQGTLNYQSRIHKFSIHLDPASNASASDPSPPNMHLTYIDSVLLTGPDDVPTTSLDADATGFISHDGFPPLPRSTYNGDGFGGPGPTNSRITLDCEGLVVDSDGDFWISDEYGPYIYRFSKQGKMLHAIMPPPSFLPLRNGTVSFSGAEPPMFEPKRLPSPLDPTAGRANNQGLEGLTISPDGRFLYAMMQSALNQEGGPKKKSRRQTRLLEYDIADKQSPRLSHEYVVTMPLYDDDGSKAAVQSEIHHLSNGQLLILARDTGFGRGAEETESKYRHVDVISTAGATSLAGGKWDITNGSIASAKGVLNQDITAATYCPFLDFNLNSELKKFGLHNGGQQDGLLLNEKWESLSLLPLPDQEDSDASPEYLLFSFSDNDFKTQNGYQNFGRFRFSDKSGDNIDTQVLAFRIAYGRRAAPMHNTEL